MILVFSLLFSPALAGEFSSADDVLAQFSAEPTIAAVHQMALDYSKTDPRYVDRWLKAAKSAAALPALTLDYNYKRSLGTDYGYYTAEDAGNDGELTEAEANALAFGPFETGQGLDYYHTGSVKASWKLSDLIMSSDEIRVINEAQDVVKLRDKVLEEVTRLYFERRRLQVDQLLGSGGELKKRVADELRRAELTAQIDAYTGGAFSRELARKR
ncbi:MAG: hypothetical protein EXR71_20055 [Myxococcales bacterium]|nr:hypothetical protein [Myxococcales bacterium]